MGPIIDIQLDTLTPFPVNPFGLYTGRRLEDLAESIQANGVLVPIIVRPIDGSARAGAGGAHSSGSNSDNGGSRDSAGAKSNGGTGGAYEVISGHNRVEASKLASLETIPAVVRGDLNDEEALLVLVETNLLQRSLADLTHSERAVTLSIHYDAIKSQGRRSDLIKEVEEMFQGEATGFERSSKAESADPSNGATSAPVGRRLESRERMGLEYGLSKNTLTRYLRVSRLIKPHQDRLDSGVFALRTAVSLSYLSVGEQELVDEVLVESRYKLSMADAEALRIEKRPLTREAVTRIVKDAGRAGRKPAAFRLEPEFLARYFEPDRDYGEIEAIIAEALDQYFRKLIAN